MKLTHYCHIKKTNQYKIDNIIVWFSALDTKPGSFNGWKSLANNYSFVLLNCEDNTWYLNGIPGLGDGYKTASYSLRALLITEFGEDALERAYFWGPSMGGFGALLYGSIIKPKSIIAAGVETDLFKPGTNSLAANKNRVAARDNDFSNMDLSGIEDIYIYSGEDFLIDVISAVKLSRKYESIKMRVVSDAPHTLTTPINKKIGVYNFINAHILKGNYLREVDTCFVYSNIVDKNYILSHIWSMDKFLVCGDKKNINEKRVNEVIKNLSWINKNFSSSNIISLLFYSYLSSHKIGLIVYSNILKQELLKYEITSLIKIIKLYDAGLYVNNERLLLKSLLKLDQDMILRKSYLGRRYIKILKEVIVSSGFKSEVELCNYFDIQRIPAMRDFSTIKTELELI